LYTLNFYSLFFRAHTKDFLRDLAIACVLQIIGNTRVACLVIFPLKLHFGSAKFEPFVARQGKFYK
jgi:hypothetical protein